MIIPGSASQSLAATLAEETGLGLANVDHERFPDGELLVELTEQPGARAIVVGSIVSNDAFLELLLLQDAAREAGATELTTVVPYLGYARQNKAFADGQPVSVRAIARALSTGTDRILVVDPHERSVLDFFTVPSSAASAARNLADPLPPDLADPIFLSPDEGARELVQEVREGYGTGEIDHFEKTRLSGDEIELAPSDAQVDGRDVVVTDDIIATGGTMSEAIAICYERGAARVYATCVHALLTNAARTRLARAGVTGIIATDTVERPASRVSAATPIAESLHRHDPDLLDHRGG